MRVAREVFIAAFVLAAFCRSSAGAPGESDQAAAERVLGPRWIQLARRSGMVFVGTVLSGGTEFGKTDRVPSVPVASPVLPPSVPQSVLRFRIDRAIAGVQPGQSLTIREWAGAQMLHASMRKGEHLLLFLYPQSRLGLTSPVGGSRGQVRLDATGSYVADPPALVNRHPPVRSPVTTAQLERAIRWARGE